MNTALERQGTHLFRGFNLELCTLKKLLNLLLVIFAIGEQQLHRTGIYKGKGNTVDFCKSDTRSFDGCCSSVTFTNVTHPISGFAIRGFGHFFQLQALGLEKLPQLGLFEGDLLRHGDDGTSP